MQLNYMVMSYIDQTSDKSVEMGLVIHIPGRKFCRFYPVDNFVSIKQQFDEMDKEMWLADIATVREFYDFPTNVASYFPKYDIESVNYLDRRMDLFINSMTGTMWGSIDVDENKLDDYMDDLIFTHTHLKSTV